MSNGHDARFQVLAEADPQVLLRVLGLFAQRSIVPSDVAMTTKGGRMHIDLRQAGLSEAAAAIISAKLHSIPLVSTVELQLIENCPC